MFGIDIVYNTAPSYVLSNENKEVSTKLKIRRWGSDEWIEPTVDVYNKDCKKE